MSAAPRTSVLDRSEPPPRGPIRHYDFPPVERRTLPNGLDLRVAHLSRLPLVSVNLFMRVGEQGLTEENAGLSVLTGDALEGGTRHRTGTELADALETIGARIDVAAGWEGTSVSLTCLADRLAEGLPLLAEMVLAPAFPEEEVARAREQHLAAIRQRRMDPASLAGDAAPRFYYAEGAPYARPLTGSLRSVGAATRERLAAYAHVGYRPVGGGLVVAGDVAADEVQALAAGCLAGWEGEPPGEGSVRAEPARRERAVWIVDRPGSVQSEIRVGHVGARRDTPDYFPLMVGNMLLGGTFTSRLNLNLRERHGFTYGVRSRFAFRSHAGPFQVSTAVANDVTAAAVREIIAELEGLVEGGPTEQEVAATRDYAAGIFGLQLETAGQVATRLTQLIVYGLPDGYFHGYRDRIREVALDEVTEAVRRHIRPAEAQIVVVGDASEIAPSLEELGLGPVQVTEAPE